MNGKKIKLTERRRAIYHMEIAECDMQHAASYLQDVAEELAKYPDTANISEELASLFNAIKDVKEKIADTRRQAQQEELHFD